MLILSIHNGFIHDGNVDVLVTINDAQNPLYANILRRFKQKTGLPVLVNTSFNAHEEPIIHTPAECLRALRDGRVDYVAAKSGVYCLR